MEIVKTHHESGLGIHAKAVKTNWREARRIGEEMIAFLDANNGHFPGEHARGFALAHCQVAAVPDPRNLIVLDKDLLGAKDGKLTRINHFFPSRIVYNVRILKKPEKVWTDVPVRRMAGIKDGKATFEQVIERRELSNKQWYEEGCMSFPNLRSKKMERYFRIKVRFWYLWHDWLPLRWTGWVEGLKAHIIQHEVDHFEAYPMYHRNKRV